MNYIEICVILVLVPKIDGVFETATIFRCTEKVVLLKIQSKSLFAKNSVIKYFCKKNSFCAMKILHCTYLEFFMRPIQKVPICRFLTERLVMILQIKSFPLLFSLSP